MFIALSSSGSSLQSFGIILSKLHEEIEEAINDAETMNKFYMILDIEKKEKVFECINSYPYNDDMRNEWHYIIIKKYFMGRLGVL